MASYMRIHMYVYTGVDNAYGPLTIHAHATRQKKP